MGMQPRPAIIIVGVPTTDARRVNGGFGARRVPRRRLTHRYVADALNEELDHRAAGQ